MASRKQGSTDHPISFTLRLTADNSLATGKTPTVELSKDGGAYAAAVDGSSNPLTVSVGGFEVGVSERLGTV